MEPAQAANPTSPDRPQLSRARVVACWVIVPVLSIIVCAIASGFAVLGHELGYTLLEKGATPLLDKIGIGLGVILGLAAAVIWCRAVVRVERAKPGAAKAFRWAIALALAATVVLHVSLIFLQAFLRNAPVQGGGLVFGAIFGIPAALISGQLLGAIGYLVLVGERQ